MDTSDVLEGGCMGKLKIKDTDDTTLNEAKNSDSVNSPFEPGTALMTVSKYALYYKMDHPKRGIAYIFNHQKFKECKERHGTEVDCKKLERCLRHLQFDLFRFNDLKLSEIKYQIDMAVSMDHTNYDCFLLVVLSHGDHNLLYAEDEAYSPNEVFFNRFAADKCPTLAGKPKLFILQSCQGKQLDSGITLVEKRMTQFDGLNRYRIPVRADILIVYATLQGHFAFRNTETGSYFLTVLCEELEKRALKDNLLVILTIIIQRVAVEFVSKNDNLKHNDKKQMPYFHSTLTRLVHFGNVNEGFIKEENSEEPIAINDSIKFKKAK